MKVESNDELSYRDLNVLLTDISLQLEARINFKQSRVSSPSRCSPHLLAISKATICNVGGQYYYQVN